MFYRELRQSQPKTIHDNSAKPSRMQETPDKSQTGQPGVQSDLTLGACVTLYKET
jgi:hypothetical protein